MTEWVPGSFALGGTALGWGLNALTDLLRRRRNARAHWNDLRRELAVRFLGATERVWVWSNNLANMTLAERTGIELTVEGVRTRKDVISKIAEADRDVRSLDTEIQLIGSDAERDAANRLREAAWSLGAAYAEYQDLDPGFTTGSVGEAQNRPNARALLLALKWVVLRSLRRRTAGSSDKGRRSAPDLRPRALERGALPASRSEAGNPDV